MTWILVGYFPKRCMTRARLASPFPTSSNTRFLLSTYVEEICSVSDCIAQGPKGWRDQGKHNVYDLYNNPNLAWSVVPVEERADFELFAYRLYLVEFEDGQEQATEDVWELPVEPMAGSFVRLGWDAVEGSTHGNFGCSPLTCNNKVCNVGSEAGIPAVNRYALVTTPEDGIRLARHFSLTKPEPGPYYVVEVWRDASSITEPSA